MNNARRTGIIIFIMVTVLLLTSAGGSDKKQTPPSTPTVMDLPPMKDQFSAYFMLGNIFNPGDVNSSGTEVLNEKLTRHYNVLTVENNMKPDQLSPSQDSYNWTIADRMVKAAVASEFKVVGHTLLWHSQIPAWQKNITEDAALGAMKKYITDVVTHFKGEIYSWDVLNEAFPDGGSSGNWTTAMRKENPWFSTIGSDFVYEAFLAARLADPDAILYYNDYNLDQSAKARLVRDMVRDVNEKYLNGRDKPAGEAPGRLLIEGIGMQSHHNTGVVTARIKNTLDLFRPLGVIISISELDVLGQSYGDFSKHGHGRNRQDRTTVTATGLQIQARLYGEYMALYIENADIIERVSFWGVTDDQSWRSAALPLLFDEDEKAKEAYYKVIEALGK